MSKSTISEIHHEISKTWKDQWNEVDKIQIQIFEESKQNSNFPDTEEVEQITKKQSKMKIETSFREINDSFYKNYTEILSHRDPPKEVIYFLISVAFSIKIRIPDTSKQEACEI